MPSWKLQYGEEDRWKLVHYIRGIFTQTEDIPEIQDPGSEIAQIYYDQSLPDSASYERGKTIFMQQCAHCHGLAGDSQGWDGAYLNPAPANLHDMSTNRGSRSNLKQITWSSSLSAFTTQPCPPGANGCRKATAGTLSITSCSPLSPDSRPPTVSIRMAKFPPNSCC